MWAVPEISQGNEIWITQKTRRQEVVAMPSWILCSRGNILEADPKTDRIFSWCQGKGTGCPGTVAQTHGFLPLNAEGMGAGSQQPRPPPKEHPGTSPPSCRTGSCGKPRDPGHPGLAEFRCQSFRLCPQTVLWTIGLHFLETVSLHVSLLNTKCR